MGVSRDMTELVSAKRMGTLRGSDTRVEIHRLNAREWLQWYASRVGDEEVEARTETEQRLEGEDVTDEDVLEAARIAAEQVRSSRDQFEEVNNVFARAVRTVLERHPDSLYQIDSFNPGDIDGFIYGDGHIVRKAAEFGNAYLIAHDVKDEWLDVLHMYQTQWASSSEQYTDQRYGVPQRQLEILDDDLGFTMRLKYLDRHGEMQQREMYFLYGTASDEAANINQEVSDEALEENKKAA